MASPPHGSLPRDVRGAIDLLRANPDRAVPIAELAANAGVSPRRLHEHFQRFLGLSPGAYGQRLRLNAVRRELRQPRNTESIAEIAARHGFAHPARFSQQYRRLFGATPSATRAENTTKAAGATIGASRAGWIRPDIAIAPFAAPPVLAGFAELFADSLALALADDATVRMTPMGARSRDTRYLVRGHLAQAGDRVRIVLGLIDRADGSHRWGEAWDAPAAALLGAIDRAVSQTEATVVPIIRESAIARALAKRPEDLDGHQLCLRAIPLLTSNTPATARQALELLRLAIERDPDHGFAAALAAWGHAQLVLQVGSASPEDDRAAALHLSARAEVLGADHAMALTARSVVHTMDGEDDAALALLERALARQPRSAWALERRGWSRFYTGHPMEAVADFGRSLRLDAGGGPKWTRLIGIAAGYAMRHRHDRAAPLMRRALGEEPGAGWINRALAVSYLHLGEPSLARHALDALRRYQPDLTVSQVIAAMRFPSSFVADVANGLSDLGLPP